MSGDFNREARNVIVHAQLHARRLGHHYVGSEHLLLAAVSTDEPAGAVLRIHGLTADRVEELIVQRAGLGAGPGLFADLDTEALAAVGIDIEAVRARIEAHFTREALARADHTVHCQARPPGRMPRRRRAAARLLGPLYCRARQTASKPTEPLLLPAELPGRYRATGPQPPGYIPFTPDAKRTMERALHEALAHQDPHAGVEHIVLALTAVHTGQIPFVLSSVGITATALRTAILDRYKQAS